MNRPYAPVSSTAATPLVETYGTLRQRRRRVVALYGGFVLLCPACALGAGRHDRILATVALAALAAGFAAFCYGFYTLLQRTFVNAANVSDGALDERQRERRDAAVLLAFRALGGTLTLAPLWATVATTAPQWTLLREPALVTFATFAVFLMAMTLPTAIMAWTEPDPLAADALA